MSRGSERSVKRANLTRTGKFYPAGLSRYCKRYAGAVTSPQIRDFRGAMQGRADKGLFMTTGSFTREATRESTRDGAPPIDLIDGDQLVDKLKELNLGMKKEVIEKITIDEEWYKGI